MGACGSSLSTHAFYGPYFGHPVVMLDRLQDAVRKQSFWSQVSGDGCCKRPRQVVWLVGDGTLDNKAWAQEPLVRASNGYESVLSPPLARKDVAYHVNHLLLDGAWGHRSKFVCVNANAAVAENVLSDGAADTLSLTPQEELVRARMRAEDVLVVSIGAGNVLGADAPDVIEALAQELCDARERVARGASAAFGDERGRVSSNKAFDLIPSALAAVFCSKLVQYLDALCALTRPAQLVIVCPALASLLERWVHASAHSSPGRATDGATFTGDAADATLLGGVLRAP